MMKLIFRKCCSLHLCCFLLYLFGSFLFVSVLSLSFVGGCYYRSFEVTLKQRLVQGGLSGAFFFFAKHETLIAKSCSIDELNILRNEAKPYADYLVSNPESYIGKVRIMFRLLIIFLHHACLLLLFDRF
jgi:hypothetical protein